MCPHLFFGFLVIRCFNGGKLCLFVYKILWGLDYISFYNWRTISHLRFIITSSLTAKLAKRNAKVSFLVSSLTLISFTTSLFFDDGANTCSSVSISFFDWWSSFGNRNCYKQLRELNLVIQSSKALRIILHTAVGLDVTNIIQLPHC